MTSMECFFCLSSSGGSARSTVSPSTRARTNPFFANSAICRRYSPFFPRTNGARTRKRVPSGIARIRSVICWIVWAEISRPQLTQWGWPMEAKRSLR